NDGAFGKWPSYRQRKKRLIWARRRKKLLVICALFPGQRGFFHPTNSGYSKSIPNNGLLFMVGRCAHQRSPSPRYFPNLNSRACLPTKRSFGTWIRVGGI